MSREQLLALVGEQATQIAALRAVNEELAARLARVEHLLSRNSRQLLDAAVAGRRSGQDAAGGEEAPWWAEAAQEGKQPGAPGANLAWTGRAR